MRLSHTTMIVPPKVALSRHERYLETASQACRACWAGLALFTADGHLRDHLTVGLTDLERAMLRDMPAWQNYLQDLAKGDNFRCARPIAGFKLPDLPPVRSSMGVSWPSFANTRAVLYVVRTQGEHFGPAETAILQSLSQLLVQESQQDESHLIAKLRVLNQVAQAAANGRELPDLFSMTLMELEKQCPWNCSAIWLADDGPGGDSLEGGKVVRLRLASCNHRAASLNLAQDMQVTVAGSTFQASIEEAAATYSDADELTRSSCSLAQKLVAAGASASFAVPLRAGQRHLGVLQCVCTRAGGFTNEQIQLFYLVADLLGPAIAQALWLKRLVDANNELRATHAHLLQTEKLRALGEMASGMAHDFNNALCGTLGFLELALLDPMLPPGARATLESSKTCALDAAETVRRVQDFARRQRTECELLPLDLDDLVRQTVELTRPRWESLRQLEKPITAELTTSAQCQVQGHPSELREALTNLIFNAVDAMPHGGTLKVHTWTRAGQAFVSVGDSGVGISEDAKRRLFEPFFTTKGERGNGLGLSVTFGIIQRHGGEITVDSKLGQGATFTIRLPVMAAPEEKATDTDHDLELPLATSQVLIVEDEESIRRFLSVGLGQLGYQLEAAASAEAALEAMATKRFDVVLTDLGLPGMSGAELARTIQELAPGTPVVLLTGWGEQIQAENQHIDGVTQILAKPVTIKALASTLAKTLATACAV